MRIQADNYQILSDADLDEKGLVFLIGSNDQGKSSLVRSIRSLLYNNIHESLIQEGKDKAEVRFKLDDEEVIWERSESNGSVYHVNNDEYTKPGRGSFERVTELGFDKLSAGPDDISLQVWDQFEPFLLLNRPNTRKFQILSKIFEADKFDDLLKNINDDKKDLSSEIDDQNAVLDEVKNEISSIESEQSIRKGFLEDNEERVKFISESSEKLEKGKELLEQLNTYTGKLKSLRSNLDNLEENLEQLTSNKESIQNKKKKLKLFAKYYSNKEQKKEFEDIVNSYNEKALQENKNSLQEKVRLVSKSSKLLSLKGDLNRSREVVELFENKDFNSGKIREKLDEYTKLKSRIETLEDQKSKLSDLESELSQLEEEKEQIENLIEKLKKDMGVCPICGSEFESQ